LYLRKSVFIIGGVLGLIGHYINTTAAPAELVILTDYLTLIIATYFLAAIVAFLLVVLNNKQQQQLEAISLKVKPLKMTNVTSAND